MLRGEACGARRTKGDPVNDFLQRGDAFAFAGIELSDFPQRKIGDGTVAISGAIHRLIVDDDEILVVGQMHVNLDLIHAQIERLLDATQVVFRQERLHLDAR